MYFIGVPNLKEINQRESYFWAQSCGFKSVQRRKNCEENQVIFRNVYLENY